VDTFTSTFKVEDSALESYKDGLNAIAHGIRSRPDQTHVSLLNSGKLESSRKSGGGASVLVYHTRQFTDRELTPEVIKELTGKRDQFGLFLIEPSTAILALELLRYPWQYTVNPTLGDILYVQSFELREIWDINLRPFGKRVPTKLGNLLNLTASMLMLEAGYFDQPFTMIQGIMAFETKINRFKLHEDFLPVRADVSIESGLKTRLTTSAMTAFSHLSQLPANLMREYLSKDPFHRTGFEEPDKLWQVLKAYKKAIRVKENSKTQA
jgi:hypothetical protein